MGRKGGKPKGKPVVMTQQEFFSSQQQKPTSEQWQKEEEKSEWDKPDIFKPTQNDNVKKEPQQKAIVKPPPSNIANQQQEVISEQMPLQKQQQVQEQAKQPVKQAPNLESIFSDQQQQTKQQQIPQVNQQQQQVYQHMGQDQRQQQMQFQTMSPDQKRMLEDQRRQQQLIYESMLKGSQISQVTKMPNPKQNSQAYMNQPNMFMGGGIPKPQPGQIGQMFNTNAGQYYMPPSQHQPFLPNQQQFPSYLPNVNPQQVAQKKEEVKKQEIKPENYEDAMKLFETKFNEDQTKKKKKKQQQQDVQDDQYYEEQDYGEEGYQEYGQEDGQYYDPNMMMDQNFLQNMISGLAQNSELQAQLDPNQLGMLMDPSQMGLLQNLITGFQQTSLEDHYEQEGEHLMLDNGQQIVLLPDDNEEEMASKNKGKRTHKNFGNLTDKELANMENDDDIIDYFLNNQEKFQVCEFFKKGNCRYGDNCNYLHPKPSAKGAYAKEEYLIDDECCICLDQVLKNKKQFGVLDGCDHTFCLDCIRNWRSTYDKRTSKHHFRTCPICRRNSYVVVPSAKMVKNGPEKDELMEEYKSALKSIPCKHFNRGKEMCPFMNSCFYAHLLPDGTPYEYAWKDNKLNEYGEWEDDTETTLADRIGNI